VVSKGPVNGVRTWLLALLVLAPSPALSFQAQTGEQVVAQRVAALMQLEEGAAPLLVLGDVNEDGQVNADDAALIEQLSAGQSPATATCQAAADLNMDGKIDATDVQVMRRMLARGPISIPALHFQYRLPCSFKRFLVAARPAVSGSETNPVYFLDPLFNTQNSKVEVVEGSANVTAMPNDRGYVVVSSRPDIHSGYITLLITLGANASGGRYYYTYPFGLPSGHATAPQSRSAHRAP
jgi:hypothetical protein